MVHFEKSFTSNPYLTGQNQLQLPYKPSYPDIAGSQWGVDSVAINFLVGVNDYDLKAGWYKAYNRYGAHVGFKREVAYKGQYISLFISLSGRCTVRFNAAKLVHTNPLNLLDPAELIPEIKKLLEALFPYVSSFRIWKKYQQPLVMHQDWVSQINLSRLDIAVNLENVTPTQLHALELGKIPRSNTKVTFKIPSKTLTIELRTKNEGKDQIYDKTHELDLEKKIKISKQVHRFESQLRGKRLRSNVKLSQVNRNFIWTLLEQRWNKAGFEVIQVSPELIAAILDLEPRIGKSIVNYIHMKQARLFASISDPTRRKYENIIKSVQETLDRCNSTKNLLELRFLYEN
jgi:hypothetical protein